MIRGNYDKSIAVLLSKTYSSLYSLVEIKSLLYHRPIVIAVGRLVYTRAFNHKEKSLVTPCRQVFYGHFCSLRKVIPASFHLVCSLRSRRKVAQTF